MKKSIFIIVILLKILYSYSEEKKNLSVLSISDIESLIVKADKFLTNYKYDSATFYYSLVSSFYRDQSNWYSYALFCRKTANSLLGSYKSDSALKYIEIEHKIILEHFSDTNRNEKIEAVEQKIINGIANRQLLKLNIASKNFNDALEMFNNIENPEKKILGNIYYNLGKLYNDNSLFDSAILYFNKSNEIFIKVYGENNSSVASNYFEIGNSYISKGDYNTALILTQKAYDIFLKIYGESNREIGDCYNNIGNIFYYKGDYKKALEVNQKALSVRLEILGNKHPDIALSYNNIGAVYYQEGDYDKALEFYQKGLLLRLEILDNKHTDIAMSYDNIGLIYYEKGDYEKALEFYYQALPIWLGSSGNKNPEANVSFNNIGMVYYEKGDYEKALEFFQKSLSIDIETLGDRHPDVASSYNNIGMIYYQKGEYDKSIEFFQKALSIELETLGDKNYVVSKTYNNIGLPYFKKREYDKALDFFQKALSIRLETLSDKHPAVAVSYNNIGGLYYQIGDFDKAITYYQKSLKITISLMGEHHPDEANIYNSLGKIYTKKKDYEMALVYYQKAFASNQVGFNDTSFYSNPQLVNILSEPFLLETITNKANALCQLYLNKTHSNRDFEASLSTYELAFQLIDNMRKKCNNENTKLLLSVKTKDYYAQAVKAVFDYNIINPLQKNIFTAFEFIENAKSATLSAQFNELNARHIASIPDSLLEKEKGLKLNLNFYNTKINIEKCKQGGFDTALVNLYENKYFTYSRQYDSLISYFETTFPEYYDLKYSNKTISVNEIQALIDDKSAIINYFIGDTSLFILTITKSECEIKQLHIDSTFEKSVTDYYRSIKRLEKNQFYDLSYKIYCELLSPVEHIISKKEKLIIVPDEYLYYVPFETLICDTLSNYKTVNNAHYLINNYCISYHYSTTLWADYKKANENPNRYKSDGFIGFAPVFSENDNNGYIVKSNLDIVDTTNINLAYRAVSSDGKKFNPLPETKDELTKIIKNFEKKNQNAIGYFNQQATEGSFKKNIKNYKFIHIATHGFTNDKNPVLSALVFSQTKTSYLMVDKEKSDVKDDDNEDGILYAGEMYNLNMNADLVVLSACETGIGKMIKGEGMLAMTRGFLYSGTPNIIYSLWRVPDKSTKDLMVEFYDNILKGNDYATALRKAKIKILKNSNTSFPKHWAGFILMGL